ITSRPLYALQAPGVDPRETPQQEVRALATAYIDAIKRVQPHGPYALVGYSFGGLVAYDMAHLLRTAGESLEAVVLLDTGIHPGSLPFRLRIGERLQQIRRRYRDLRRQGGLHFVRHGVQSALSRLRR